MLETIAAVAGFIMLAVIVWQIGMGARWEWRLLRRRRYLIPEYVWLSAATLASVMLMLAMLPLILLAVVIAPIALAGAGFFYRGIYVAIAMVACGVAYVIKPVLLNLSLPTHDPAILLPCRILFLLAFGAAVGAAVYRPPHTARAD